MPECRKGLGDERDPVLSDNAQQESGIKCRRDRQKILVRRTKKDRRFQNSRQIHADFLHPAARHECDPLLGWVKVELSRVLAPVDGGVGEFRKGMAHKGGVYPTIAVELFLKREDDESLIDVVAEQAHASLAPGPELRRHIIYSRYSTPLHLPCDSPIKSRRVDDDRDFGLALVGFPDQLVVESPDSWQMAENFGDSDNGKFFGVDHRVASGGAHAVSADTKKCEGWIEVA